MSKIYCQKDNNGNIISVMEFDDNETPTKWVLDNCFLTDKPIVQLIDGSYQFEDEVDWNAEEAKRKEVQFQALKDSFTNYVENWMNTTVRERNYDDVTTCIGRYYNSPTEKFRDEARAVNDWVSAVWVKCYAILDEVVAGTRSVPTREELIAELPILYW